MQLAEQLLAILEVAKQLQATVTHEIVSGPVAKRLHITRAYSANREGTDSVGTTHIKLFAIRSHRRVSEAPYIATIEVGH